jgi:hypothetical protein
MRMNLYVAQQTLLVMPGLVPGIHAFPTENQKGVDGRDRSGHDGLMYGTIDTERPHA